MVTWEDLEFSNTVPDSELKEEEKKRTSITPQLVQQLRRSFQTHLV